MTDQRFARRPRICFDTETTGLYWRSGDRVCEIGAVRLDEDFRPVARFHSYVNPQRPMNEGAYRVHGLSDAFLADAPVFADIAADFLAFTKGAELIAHNAVFDVGFVNNELSIAGFPSLEENGCTALCTLTLSRLLYPGIRHSLTDLCRHFGIDDSRRVKHGALLDAELLAEVTKKLLMNCPQKARHFLGTLLWARRFQRKFATKFCCCFSRAHALGPSPQGSALPEVG